MHRVLAPRTRCMLRMSARAFKNGESFSSHSMKRSSDHLTVGSSILLITTTKRRTPSV
jgi:hypothetical protein